MLLGVVRETGLEDRVTGDLTEVTATIGYPQIIKVYSKDCDLPGEFPDLGGNAVLFHQRLLGEVEL